MSVQITGNQIKNAAIGSSQLADDSIITAKIASASISAAKMQANAILEAALSDGAVTLNKLGSASVSTAKLQDNSISAAKLQAGSCGTSALAALSVTEAKLASSCVTSSKLASNSVLTAAVSDAQITKDKLSANAVDSTVMDMTASYDFSSGTVRVATTPSNGNDATSKSYVDNLSQGAHFKKAVQVAASSNVNLSNLPNSVDGQTLSVDDRFAVLNQTTASENGIYAYAGSGNAASRTSDMDQNADFPAAAFFVVKGTNGDKAYVCTNDAVTLGATAITFTQFAGAGSSTITASGGLTKVGEDISIASSGVTTAKIADANITSAKMAADSILTAAISNNQITNAKMADDSVGAAELIDASVGTVAIADAAITSQKLGANSVLTAAISDAQITSSKLASNSVLTAAISDAQITSSKLAADSVTSSAIANTAINDSAMFNAGVVDSNALASSSVVASKIASGAVGTSALAAASVDTSKLSDSSVSAAKLSISFKQEGFQIGNGTTTTLDLSVAIASNMVNAVLVFKNGLSIKNMTAMGDTAADTDEFNVSATGGGSGVCRLTFGSALENGSTIEVWFIQ